MSSFMLTIMDHVLLAIPSIMAALTGLFAAIQGLRNQKRIDELHILVNSRLTELLAVSNVAARAQGAADALRVAASAASVKADNVAFRAQGAADALSLAAASIEALKVVEPP